MEQVWRALDTRVRARARVHVCACVRARARAGSRGRGVVSASPQPGPAKVSPGATAPGAGPPTGGVCGGRSLAAPVPPPAPPSLAAGTGALGGEAAAGAEGAEVGARAPTAGPSSLAEGPLPAAVSVTLSPPLRARGRQHRALSAPTLQRGYVWLRDPKRTKPKPAPFRGCRIPAQALLALESPPPAHHPSPPRWNQARGLPPAPLLPAAP